MHTSQDTSFSEVEWLNVTGIADIIGAIVEAGL
jgi:hypothetical protein